MIRTKRTRRHRGQGGWSAPNVTAAHDVARLQHQLAGLLRRPATGYRKRLLQSGQVRFLSFDPIARRTPIQGWKLHLSATVPAYAELIRLVLPVLTAERAAFKVTGDMPSAMHLNGGRGGLSQIGKLVTVYPRDRDQARRIAIALDRVIGNLPGPDIAGDFTLRRGSRVFFRYGAFVSRWMTGADGLPQPAIRAPDGRLLPDSRSLRPNKPRWVRPPFNVGGTDRTSDLLRNRYLLFGELARHHKGAVFAAIDVRTGSGCAVKHAFPHAHPYGDQTSAVRLARRERDALKAVGDLPVVPVLLDYWEGADGAYLVQPLVNALDLQKWVASLLAEAGRGSPPVTRIVHVAALVAAAIRDVHALGWVHRDIKPGNILIDADDPDRVWLIDWETAGPIGTLAKAASTRGYRAPGGPSDRADPAEDWCGFGRVLIFLSTGFDLSRLADEDADPRQVLATCAPSLPPELAQDIALCLEGRAWPPPASGSSPPHSISWSGREVSAIGGTGQRARVGDALFTTMVAQADFTAPDRCVWRSGQPYAYGRETPFINIGGAGVLLYLAERLARTGDERTRHLLGAGLNGLEEQILASAPLRPGLMMGADGAMLAARIAATALGRTWTPAASWQPAELPEKLDFFDGLAGVVHAHSLMNTPHGAAARRLVETVRNTGSDTDRLAEDHLEGQMGYAHGVAGVMATLALHAPTLGGERIVAMAVRLGDQLLAGGRSVPGAPHQRLWPGIQGDVAVSHGWCHGTVGFGKAFLTLAQTTGAARFRQAAEGAGETVMAHRGPLDSTLCHGLGGAIDFLIDLAESSTDQAARARWMEAAESAADALLLHSTVRAGQLVFVSETPEIVTCDYLVGMAGVAAVLERLAAPRLPACLP